MNYVVVTPHCREYTDSLDAAQQKLGEYVSALSVIGENEKYTIADVIICEADDEGKQGKVIITCHMEVVRRR